MEGQLRARLWKGRMASQGTAFSCVLGALVCPPPMTGLPRPGMQWSQEICQENLPQEKITAQEL